jgi:predicted nucleotidyltransferase
MIQLPSVFSDLLKSLNTHEVKYLVIGGYAVVYHGHPRMTGDIDIWVEQSPVNAERVSDALNAFGFDPGVLAPGTFLKDNQLVRMGHPPFRVEVMTSPSGVDFAACYERRVEDEIEGAAVPFISLSDLKQNKQASGRTKDLNDLEQLP